MKFPRLNLPEYDFSIKIVEDRPVIWDFIRKKDIILTPEEWVRQHFLRLLVDDLKYPKGLISVESGLEYNQRLKRTDIKVYRDNQVFLLVECKSPSTKINALVLNQIGVYNKNLKASYLAVTNGLQHHLWKKEKEDYLAIDSFPEWKS